MARATVTILGLKNLRRQLAELPDEMQTGARRAVRDSADEIRDEVRDSIRVDTGRLRAGTRTRLVGADDLTADVGWFDKDLYYAQFLEFGTSSIRADPVLTRAGEAQRLRFPARVRVEVVEAIG